MHFTNLTDSLCPYITILGERTKGDKLQNDFCKKWQCSKTLHWGRLTLTAICQPPTVLRPLSINATPEICSDVMWLRFHLVLTASPVVTVHLDAPAFFNSRFPLHYIYDVRGLPIFGISIFRGQPFSYHCFDLSWLYCWQQWHLLSHVHTNGDV